MTLENINYELNIFIFINNLIKVINNKYKYANNYLKIIRDLLEICIIFYTICINMKKIKELMDYNTYWFLMDLYFYFLYSAFLLYF
jgi:hypothetical protein